MIMILILSLAMQVPSGLPPDFNFGAFDNKKPLINSSANSGFPAQNLPENIKRNDYVPPIKQTVKHPTKQPSYFFAYDDTGKRWKSLDKNALERKIQQVNSEIVWEMEDKWGQKWSLKGDKEALKKFIEQKNIELSQPPRFFFQTTTPFLGGNVFCAPGGG